MSEDPQYSDITNPESEIGRHAQVNEESFGGAAALPPEQPARVEMPDHRPVVTYSILAITIFVFLLQMSGEYLLTSGLWQGCPYFATFDMPACYGMKVNQLIANYGEWWRLFTPMLLHGSLLHIGFNMYALYILGTSLEGFYGHWQLLTLYIVSGFAGTVVSFAFTDAPSLGASTAVFGLIGAQGVFAYQNQKVFGALAKRAFRDIVRLALINLFIGYSLPGIDNWGHVGGLVGGTAIAWFGGPKFIITGNRPNLSLQNQRMDATIALAGSGVLVIFATIARIVIVL